eukprot:TRINITY_DN38468_c0_g1_i1.p2 TRINITY_DN38468_c0_g1~~TRINITY_DN38468_c0_g1_i1.p2  ORF type:complete len:133 (-),score=23.74 TRINITY_DN38468_c0_g1_i1:399-797(-)
MQILHYRPSSPERASALEAFAPPADARCSSRRCMVEVLLQKKGARTQKLLKETAELLLSMPDKSTSLTSLGRLLERATLRWLRRHQVTLGGVLRAFDKDFVVDMTDRLPYVVYLHVSVPETFQPTSAVGAAD